MKNSNKGFTLVQAVVGMVIIGVTSYTVIQVMSRSQQVATQSNRSSEVEFLLEQASESARRVVSDVGSLRNGGVCRFMKAEGIDVNDRTLTSGLAKINLELYPTNGTPDPMAAEWSTAFPTGADGGWVSIPCSEADASSLDGNRYARCFKPNPERWPQIGTADVVKSQDIQVIVQMEPVILSARSTGGLLSSDNNQLERVELPTGAAIKKVNARDHGFLMSTRLTWVADTVTKKRDVRGSYGLIWAGEYSCVTSNVPAPASANCPGNQRQVVLSPSAIGSGSLDSCTISLFSSTRDENRDELSATFEDVTFTKASIGARQRAVTESGKGISFSAACIESEFRCKRNVAKPRVWGAAMDLRMSLGYHGRIAKAVKPSVNFVNSTETASAVETLNTTSGSFTMNYQHPQRPAGSPTFNLIPNTPASTNLLSLHMGNMQQAACPRMCTDDGVGSNWRAEAAFSGISGSYRDANPVGCVCCNMKQCGAWGNKSISCEQQSPEAADARVPECDGGDVALVSTEKFLPDGRAPAVVASDVGKCLAVSMIELPGQADKLVYSYESCSTSLPVACFAVGRYFATRTGAAFANAANLCYGLGRQEVNTGELTALLATQGNTPPAMPPTSGGNYNYIDGALTGQFVAPQSEDHEPMIMDAFRRVWGTRDQRIGKKVWVNLQVNAASRIEMPILWSAPDANSATNGWVTFYSSTYPPQLWVRKDQPHSFATSTGDRMVLAHSRRYVGALAVNATQTRDLPVLCLKGSTGLFFTTLAKTTNIDAGGGGNALCAAEGGVYTSPSSSAQWSNALLAVAKPHRSLPWPEADPANVAGVITTLAHSANHVHAAWVALKKDATSWVPANTLAPFSANPSLRANAAFDLGGPAGGPISAYFAICSGPAGSVLPVVKRFASAPTSSATVQAECGADGYFLDTKLADRAMLKSIVTQVGASLGATWSVNQLADTMLVLKNTYTP